MTSEKDMHNTEAEQQTDTAEKETSTEYDLTEALDMDMEIPSYETEEEQSNPLEVENAQLKDALLRALAEAENIRKRSEREIKDARIFAITNFAKDLLSVIDNLRRATSSVPEDILAENEMLRNVMTGVQMTEQELVRAFERHQVTEIKAEGEAFDPQLHEALFEVPNDDVPAGTILNVVESGWIINERLLRPTRVGVSTKIKD